MSQRSARLCRGDLVEVKPPDEIVQTLDAEGALDHLPFMPEMLEFCGRTFRVSRRALTICISGPDTGVPRGFRVDDVVTLDSVRCSGAAHDGCQKACMIFWREAWLRKVEDTAVRSQVDLRGMDQLRARLKVSTGPKIYYCQASELSKATQPLSRWEKWGRYLSGLRAGNFNVLQMALSIGIWLFWFKIRRMFLGVYARGSSEPTPAEGLNLQPGEWVEVKSMQSIIETLNERGDNRGLHFSDGYAPLVRSAVPGEGAARQDNRGWDGTDEAAPQHGVSRRLNLRMLLHGLLHGRVCARRTHLLAGDLASPIRWTQ